MQGAVHKIRRQWRGGRGQKFVNIYQRIGVKNCRHGGGGCQKSGKIADIFYTLLIAEILSGKNARAWVSMDFTQAGI